MPVQTLIEYLEAGHPLDQFLEDYPSVTREHAIAVLELAKRALVTPAAVTSPGVDRHHLKIKGQLD